MILSIMTMMTCLPLLLALHFPLLSNSLASLAIIPCLVLVIYWLELKEAIIIVTVSIFPIHLIPKSTMMATIINLILYFLSLPLSHLLLLFASLTVRYQFQYFLFLSRHQFLIIKKKKKKNPFILANIHLQWQRITRKLPNN